MKQIVLSITAGLLVLASCKKAERTVHSFDVDGVPYEVTSTLISKDKDSLDIYVANGIFNNSISSVIKFKSIVPLESNTYMVVSQDSLYHKEYSYPRLIAIDFIRDSYVMPSPIKNMSNERQYITVEKEGSQYRFTGSSIEFTVVDNIGLSSRSNFDIVIK